MSTSRAVVVRNPGPDAELVVEERPLAAPGAHEVRVRVRATAVNRADLLQRRGFYPAPPGAPADVLGLELAGEVDAVGPGVTELAVGDPVWGIAGGGTYASHAILPARTLARLPDGLAFEDAAALPEACLTAWDALVTQAGLAVGDALLVHAVGSGVGVAALQIAKALGARVLGTSRTAEKLARARALALDDGLVVEGARFADDVRRLTGGRGADVVLDLVGGAYVGEDVRAAAEGGRVVVVGLTGGAAAELDLGVLLRRRVTVRGTVLRARPLEEKIALARVLEARIGPLVARGLVRPVVEDVLPLERAADAHARLEANDTFGKIVLRVD